MTQNEIALKILNMGKEGYKKDAEGFEKLKQANKLIEKHVTEQLRLKSVGNCFKIEVHNKNGAWYEIVLAKTYNEAKGKAEKKYQNNTHISLVCEYDKPIF